MRARLYSMVFWPFVFCALMYIVYLLSPLLVPPSGDTVSIGTLISAASLTVLRLAIAYVLAVLVAIPLAILTTYNATVESFLLPIFDIFESIPILAVFPVVVLVFIQWDFLNGAAVLILFLNMLWNIVFALVGGLKMIPKDITSAAHVFGIRGFSYVRRVMLPAVFPQLVTGSILAVADGWNIIIVAEAIHTYIPHGSPSQDLFGIGSILVAASANGQKTLFLMAVLVMVVVIGLINFFVWQKLLHYSQRFRFD